MSKVKVAIIGCGGIANQKHFPALKNNSDLNEIVAFCDIKIERAEGSGRVRSSGRTGDSRLPRGTGKSGS